jgi:hypothetical protein
MPSSMSAIVGEHGVRRRTATQPILVADPPHTLSVQENTPILHCGSPGQYKICGTSFASSFCSTRTDITERLEVALDHVQAMRCQAIERLSLAQPIHLPCELAKTWLESRSSLNPGRAPWT